MDFVGTKIYIREFNIFITKFFFKGAYTIIAKKKKNVNTNIV